MIQDIAPSVFHNEYTVKEPSKDDYVFVFRGIVDEAKDLDVDWISFE